MHMQTNQNSNLSKSKDKTEKDQIEYDWEEPARNFFYRFTSDCKELSYTCMIPKGVEEKNRILKVDTETGLKILPHRLQR